MEDEISMAQIKSFYEREKGCINAKRIRIEVSEGGGKVIARYEDDICDTSKGCNWLWICPGGKVGVRAEPFAGWEFGFWTLDGNPVSSEPKTYIQLYKGTIGAHFIYECTRTK
ncbi:MAG: hypothetical protein HXS46_07715 [Theionarchaea archaeon]|nr:hypothetical protein [Theionarchaea archaeon]